MKLVGSTKSKIIKNKDDENVPHVEITESLLVHCDIFNNDYQRNSRFCIHLLQVNCFVNC